MKISKLWDSIKKIIRPEHYTADLEYRKFFFRHAHILTVVLFVLGLTAAIVIYFSDRDPFKAIAIIFLSIWLVVFLRYFLWAVYHYNVNFGLSIKDWERIENAKNKLEEGESVLREDLDIPKFNPYRSQTFGVPPGTVRGMLAFTLLFGAISILIVSMGMDEVDLENSLIRDQFEFFKTAFLMMMAFYFGDKSLKFLQSRWRNPNALDTQKDDGGKDNGEGSAGQGGVEQPPSPNTVQTRAKRAPIDMMGEYDRQLVLEDMLHAQKEGISTNLNEGATLLKSQLNQSSFVSPAEAMVSLYNVSGTVANQFLEDGQMTCDHPCTPIIDAGHGGMVNGKYSSGDKKLYRFQGTNNDFEIFEGVINRAIARKLIAKLEKNGYPYYDLNAHQEKDMSLPKRVAEANKIYAKDKSAYFLSIHSNAASTLLAGTGNNAHGFEIWTSKGETPSDILARIAKKEYLKSFSDKFRFRGVKERNFNQKDLYVLANTVCPAILVENLFFDNHKEALYLMSQKGQDEIAECLLNVVKSIRFYYEQ